MTYYNLNKNQQNSPYFVQTLQNTEAFSKNNSSNYAEAYYPQALDLETEQNSSGQDFHLENPLPNENTTPKEENRQSNLEKMLNFLKNGSSNDLMSTLLASGAMKNQSPIVIETLSKMIKKEQSPAPKQKNADNSFEEM